MIRLEIGTPVRIVGGANQGLTGTVLRGSVWAETGYHRRGVLYQVQIDNTRGFPAFCWGADLARFQ